MELTQNTLHYTASKYNAADHVFTFTYIAEGKELQLTLAHSTPSALPQETIERIGFNLGMCYLLDLAEILLPQTIVVYKQLPPLALQYWKQLYEEVVVEKCYALQLPSAHKYATWITSKEPANMDQLVHISGPQTHAALCLTGGKESLAILKTLEGKKPLLLFFLNLEMSVHRQKVYELVRDAHDTVATRSNREDLFVPLKATHGGLHSGVDMAHLVFNTMLHADVCKYVLIGNEYSSNYPNDIYEGSSVNHQYVKTIEFAKKLNDYVHSFVTQDFTYYSPFFGLYEYKIADLLFKDDKYLDVWTSCNQTTDDVNFCSNCHKCAFTYLVARTQKSEAYLGTFFSHNMLEDVALFRPLIDFTGKKPLDCVGDRAEVWVALEALLQQQIGGAVIDYYAAHIRPAIADDLPAYSQQVTSIQRVPIAFPEDIQHHFYDGLGLQPPLGA
jgi:hypothetical protein